MTTEPNNTPPGQGQMPASGEPTGQMPTSPQGQIPQGQNQQQSSTTDVPFESLPLSAQDEIKRLRKENEQRRKQFEAKERAEQQLKEDELKKQGEFQKLAEQHAARVKELEPVVAERDALVAFFNEQIKEQIKEWPQEVKAFDPGETASVRDRMDWMKKSQSLFSKLGQQQAANLPGNRPNPQPANASSGASQDRTELYRRYNAQRGNII